MLRYGAAGVILELQRVHRHAAHLLERRALLAPWRQLREQREQLERREQTGALTPSRFAVALVLLRLRLAVRRERAQLVSLAHNRLLLRERLARLAGAEDVRRD